MHNPKAKWTLAAVLVLLLALGAGAGILRRQATLQPVALPPAEQEANEAAFERYAPEPGGESAELQSMEDYWHTRVSYPTGQFNGAWLLNAATQDKQVAERVPAGRVIYQRPGNAPLALDPNSWTSLGPQPLESNGCSGCYSYGHVAGRVNWIAVDPVSPNVAYLVTVGGGVWKTTNCCTAGTTWAPTMDDPLVSTTSVDHMVIDPNNHNTLYVGTGDLNFGSFSMGSAGLLKSTDAGATWTIKGAGVFAPIYPQPSGVFPQYNAIGKVGVDPRNSNTVIAGTKTGVFFSYNGGDTWSGPCLTNAFPTQRQDVTGLLLRDTGSSTDLYVAVGARGYSTTVQVNLAENGANGIYKTTVPASGCPASWTLSSTPANGWPTGTGSGIPVYQAGGDTLGRIDMAFAPSTIGPGSTTVTLYAIVQAINPTGNRGGVLGVWKTTDGGTSWTQTATAANMGGCDSPGTQSWYNQNIAVDPNDPNTVFADAIDIFRSTNGGTAFTNLTCGYAGGTTVHVDQHALAFVPGSSTTLLTGSDGGSYVTLNANAATPTFSRLNDSLNTIEFYAGDITANFATSNAPGVNAGAQDNGSSVYVWPSNNVGPALWQLRNGGDGMYARIEPVLAQRWYQESQNGNLRVTTAGPYSSLTSATGGWTGDRRSFVFPYEIYKYDCPPTGCTHLIAGSYRVWETILGGTPGSTWYANSPDLTKNTLADRSTINQLSYAVSMSTTAIVGTNDGNVQYGFGLGAGTANSATWVNVTGGNTVLPNRPILDVATDPVNPLVGYAAIGGFDENTPGTPGHLYQVTCTANCGSFTWVNKSGNLPNIPIDSVIANPLYPQQVFLGSDWGLYYTNDITAGSPTWFRFQTGMPNVMIWDMSIDRGFTTLAVFTRGRGAYVWPLPAGPFGASPTPTVTGTPPTATPTSTPVPPNTATPTTGATQSPTPTPCGPAAWITETPLPTVKGRAVGVSTSNAIYLFGGRPDGATYTDDIYRYDLAAHTWSQVPTPFPDLQSSNMAGGLLTFPEGQRIFVVGGNGTGSTYTGRAVAFDPATNTFTTKASWPASPARLPGGWAVVNNKFYIFGGITASATGQGYADNWVYDPATDAWAQLPTNLSLARGYIATEAFGNVVYLAGGSQNNAGVLTDEVVFEKYDVSSNVITPGPDLLTAKSNNHGYAFDGKFLVAGGGFTVVDTLVQVYDPVSNTWSIGPAMVEPVRNYAKGYGMDGSPYAIGGFDAQGSTSYDFTQRLVTGPCGTPTPGASATATPTTPPQATATTTATATATVCAITFNDVPANSTFYTWIRCLACRGIVGGYPCGGPGEPCPGNYYRPNNNVTRGQVSKIVSESAAFADPVPSTQQTFEDVPPSGTFWLWVERLSTRDIIQGYPCGGPFEPCVGPTNRPYFRPNNNVTRGQLSKITSGAAGWSETPTGQTFEDVPPSQTFYLYVERMAVRGIIQGYPCGGPFEPCVGPANRPYFRPNNNATRGQMAKIAAEAFFPNCQTPARQLR
jgi:hypothetical protein